MHASRSVYCFGAALFVSSAITFVGSNEFFYGEHNVNPNIGVIGADVTKADVDEVSAFTRILGTVLGSDECLVAFGNNNVHTLLGRIDAQFWSGHPNRISLAKAAAIRLSSESGPEAAIREMCRIFIARKLSSKDTILLTQVTATAAFATTPIPWELLSPLLRDVGPELGPGLLRGYVANIEHIAPNELYNKLENVVKAAGWIDGIELDQQLLIIATSSAAGLADIHDLQGLLKSKGANGSNPAVISRILGNLMATRVDDALSLLAIVAAENPANAVEAASKARLSPDNLAEAASRMDPSVRKNFLLGCADRLWGLSPLDALAFAETFGAEKLPLEALSTIGTNLLPLGSGEVANWLHPLDSQRRNEVLSSMLSEFTTRPMVSLSPQAAKAWLEAAKESAPLKFDDVKWAIAKASRVTDHSDLRKYADLVQVADKGAIESVIFKALSYNLACEDPAALEAIVENESQESKQQFPLDAIALLGTVNYKAAMDWALRTHNAAIRIALNDGLISCGSSDMPIELRKEISLQRLADKVNWKDSQPAIDRLIQEYASSNPPQAFDILQALPDSDARNEIVTKFVKTWAASDPVAASDWLVQMPANRTRDLAVKELVLASRDDPEMAVANISAIADKPLRLAAARSLIDAWKNLDPKWIAQLFRSGSISQEDQAEIGVVQTSSR